MLTYMYIYSGNHGVGEYPSKRAFYNDDDDDEAEDEYMMDIYIHTSMTGEKAGKARRFVFDREMRPRAFETSPGLGRGGEERNSIRKVGSKE